MATREELRQQLAGVESEIAELQAELAQGPPLAIRNAIEGELSMLQARAASLRQQIAAMGPKSFAMVDDELPGIAEAPPATVEVNAAATATPAAKAVARPRKRPSATKVAAKKAVAKKAVAKKAAAKKAAKPKPRKRTAAKAKAKASKRVK